MPDLQEHPTHRLSSIASIIRPSCPPYKRGGRVVDENFTATEPDHRCGRVAGPTDTYRQARQALKETT